MPAQPKTTIAGQLNAARVAINNTLADSELHAMVALYGYTNDRMREGQRLYDAAIAAVNAQVAAAGTQRQATLQARTAEQQARASYQALAQLSRAVFARIAAQRTTLGLGGKTPQVISEFLTAAATLFENAMNLPDIQQELGKYGYTAERLTQECAAIAAFEQANQAQVAAIGAAQQATRDQRVALTALNQWVAQYLKIAKIALRSKPELVEKIGGVARSARTAAQRGAAKKAAATRAAKLAA
jgi:hypothetical protein